MHKKGGGKAEQVAHHLVEYVLVKGEIFPAMEETVLAMPVPDSDVKDDCSSSSLCWLPAEFLSGR